MDREEEEKRLQHQREQRNNSNYRSDQKNHPSYHHTNDDNNNDIEIGRTIASDKYTNTIDSFWFAIKPEIVVNPFDFVTVEHMNNYIKTIGMVQDLRTIGISDNRYLFQNTERNENREYLTTDTMNKYSYDNNNNFQNSVIIARVGVMASFGVNLDKSKISTSIWMPVGLGKSVKFANAQEVMFALGVPQMVYPVPAGIIEMSNGLQIPIFLDISYIVGPDTTHVNASGISGNAKTSYLLFLLQSIYQKLKEHGEEFGLIIFNTKDSGLLKIDKKEEKLNVKEKNEKFFNILGLDLEPFENVTYFLPRGKDGKPNSIHIPENSRTYSYELNDVYDRLELLFSEIYDPHYDLSSIINYIYEFWPIKYKTSSPRRGEGEGNEDNIKNWTDLFNFKGYPEEITTNRSSLLHFQGHIHRFRKSSLFIDKKVTSTYLGKEIRQMSSGDVFVIDTAMLSSLEEQAFVIGDVMKSIDEMYSATSETFNDDDTANYNKNRSRKKKKPKYLLIFIDEINRFLPKSRSTTGRIGTVAEQIMKTIIAGRSRGTILFSAQQFKSTVDYALHENTGLHMTAKVGLSELSTVPYNMIDESTKMNIVRLNKGELVMVHSAFRYPVKITFPEASFKRH